jgi:hypothetical protein
MSPRNIILRTLSRRREQEGESALTRPASIAGFSENPEKFQKAVNELLKDRLVDGMKDPEGRMALSLNAHRLSDVRKELRPVWARPAVWAVVTLLVVAVVGLVGA